LNNKLDLQYSSSSSKDDSITMEELIQQLHDLVVLKCPDVSKTTIVGLGFGTWIAVQLLNKHKLASNLVVISFVLPTSNSILESLRKDLSDRVTLAQKWGMQVIADKAAVTWMSQDDRNSEKWNRMKGIILETSVEELRSLSSCYILSLDSYWADANVSEHPFQLTDVRVLFVTASSDGDMPEKMASCLALTGSHPPELKVIQQAPRLFWWGSAGELFARDLESWIKSS
jgi:pimeloyl-ACP methyl ester carboxylesterase